MHNYIRLTNNNREEYNPEYDFCVGCKYFGEPCGCNRPDGTCDNYERFIETYNRLAEVEDKIEQGLMIELPCKVGDTVYWVFELVKGKLEILEGKVRGLSLSQNNTSWFSVIYEYGLTFEHTFKDNWNKTVFPTKAKAEQKLKELKGEI